MQRIDIRVLAYKAGVCVGTIRKHVSGLRHTPLLEGLPAPVARGTKLLWLDSDIEYWLASQTTTHDQALVTQDQARPVKRGRGRPRKSEREREKEREKEQSS